MDAVLNAMTTKTKAIYAKRLKDTDYNNLVQKRSVPEIASYLKNETYFRDSLDGINEKLFDVVGDTVIEFGAGGAQVIEDYEDEVRGVLGI